MNGEEPSICNVNTQTKKAEEACIRIRPFQPQDQTALVALGQAEDMGTLDGFETTLVAEDRNGRVAGFCRVRIFDGQAYVNPLVTAPEFRHQGIGAKLMHAAGTHWGELRFVARGYAVPFYRSIGSVDAPWSSICEDVASDCDGCTLYPTCHPQPMSYVANGNTSF